ncbi:MAG: hypothetical protein M0Z66_03600 [Thermaerobacter sp.]|nr:hypothetical protein [Thermaerobacter sp.]
MLVQAMLSGIVPIESDLECWYPIWQIPLGAPLLMVGRQRKQGGDADLWAG